MVMSQSGNPQAEVQQLRSQGLTDDLILDELTRRGYSVDQVNAAIQELETEAAGSEPGMQTFLQPPPQAPVPTRSAPAGDESVYERIEEIAESMIDEKWDDLLAEVKKIVEWKEKMEDRQRKMQSDLEQLKDSFSVLHEGVLGKLGEYDARMGDVSTELKAVGKVFKDVIPEFVENVKELRGIVRGKK